MGTVNDIPDSELLRRAARSFPPVKREGSGIPRWEAVSRVFCLGSTYSRQLCHRLGIDPDERVRSRP